MKRPTIFIFFALLLSVISCGSNEPVYTPPTDPDPDVKPDVPQQKKIYSWEKDRDNILKNTDLVLLYGGSHHRPKYLWDQERVESCVTYTDENNEKHWFFDSFLLIEFTYTEPGQTQRDFATGYSTYSGTKGTWTKLLDYWFADNSGIGAIDKAIEAAKATLGEPPYKRQIILTLPEPIKHEMARLTSSSTAYWGSIDGKMLDFAKVEDQEKALEWYIDEARARFNEKNYSNVELAGFYWVAEEANHAASVIPEVSQYLHKYKYSLNWIPWFKAPGYDKWKDHGFDVAYMQPNYFFKDNVEYSRFADAFTEINKYDMGLEVEFDSDAVSGMTSRYCPDRLRDYLKTAKEYKAWNNRRIAYYHGNDAIYELAHSSKPADQKLYHEFGHFVVDRPYRVNFKP